jgi:hypothetical protein
LKEAYQTGFVSGGMMRLLEAISKGKVIRQCIHALGWWEIDTGHWALDTRH